MPKLSQDPPNLLGDDDTAFALPSQPRDEICQTRETVPPTAITGREPSNESWQNGQARQQEEYETE
ncbi:sla2 Src-like adaptor 2 [Elasticomyces elasticus]|nr:sla2 Src-like adaptor 2 [Elasticomyces elasticus]